MGILFLSYGVCSSQFRPGDLSIVVTNNVLSMIQVDQFKKTIRIR